MTVCPSVDPTQPDPARWEAGLDELVGRFARVESRSRARSFLLGLTAGLPRVNCETIAEHVGEPNPDGMQHFLARAAWDIDGARRRVGCPQQRFLHR